MQASRSLDRRSFLKKSTAAAAAAPFFVRNLISAPPSSIIRLGAFGASNMAFVNIRMLVRNPKIRFVTVAEVDADRLHELKNAKYQNYTWHQDWRRMLDREARNLDAVCVATPDHMHAANVMASLQRGLHVYGQKPLAHNIYECRKLAEVAGKKKLVTQMGIQIHSRSEYKTAVALVQSGAIGKIKEVHSWSEKKWGDMDPKPERTDPIPPTLDWDLWLGPREPRPYLDKYYHPAMWRKRTDFGTATFGDMGCHILDPVFSALQLTAPLTVRSEGPAPTKDSWAVNTLIKYVFPATPHSEGKTVNLTWYDGDLRPPQEVQNLVANGKPLPGQGSIFIGTKGVLLVPHMAPLGLFPEADYKDFQMPQFESVNHYDEWVEAVLGNGKTSTPFSYSGPLTESVLLGPIATHFPNTTLEWDARKMKFKNSKEATTHSRAKYRKGWKMKNL